MDGFKSIVKSKFKVSTTDSDHDYKIAPNILDRDFQASQSGLKWVSDITYIDTQEDWLYLTTIIDLFDRKAIGWSFSDTLQTTSTIIPAWNMAIKNRAYQNELIFHSDRGIQYASDLFRSTLENAKVTQSMSRKGNCWDNAVAESFFKILKSELVDHSRA